MLKYHFETNNRPGEDVSIRLALLNNQKSDITLEFQEFSKDFELNSFEKHKNLFL
jgi:hypothetical protein